MKDWQKFTALILAISVIAICHAVDTNASKDIELSKVRAETQLHEDLVSVQKDAINLVSDTMSASSNRKKTYTSLHERLHAQPSD